MVIPLLYKNTLIKIRKSFGRFLSLLLIMMVGVGFFAGIRESTPDIIASLSRYMNRQKLMNFEIVSTMGLTDDDVRALRALTNVATVTPGYSLDVLSGGKAIRIQAIEQSVNTVQLIDGRMPENDAECVADSRHYKLGDKIAITGDVGGKLKNTQFTVVGRVKSSLFLSDNYGSTTVGDGKLYSFIFVDRDNFTLDAYTRIDITAAGADKAAAFSAEYDDAASKLSKELVGLKPERENARYQEIYDKASQEIQEHENTLTDEKSKGEKELADAKAQLDANARKLSDARRELEKNESDLQDQITARNAEFQTAKTQIADGWNQIDAALQANGLTRVQLNDKISELDSAIRSLKEQQSALPAASPEYAQLDAQIAQYTASRQGLLQLQTSVGDLTDQENQLNEGIATFNSQVASAEVQIAQGKTKLARNQKKLDDGYAEYNKNAEAFQAQIADAQAKIQDAKASLSAIEKPKWTILNRGDVVNGYNDLESAMKTINMIAAILPLFFILIVALMTSNTMARMIAEERGELGTLASLGFTDRSIISTYLLYVLSATVLGTSGGFFLGCTILPKIVYSCFPYILPPLIIRYDIPAFLLILAAAAALMTVVTVAFCRHELKEKPAALMRPVPPKKGKTILLEKAGFIWKHLSFTWKVTMRNIFRYKQRVFMTVVGIAGCTALLLTGFGIRDCINGVAQKQYGEIFHYRAMFVLKNDTESISGDLETLLTKEDVKAPALLRQTALTCLSGSKAVDAYLVVPENEETAAKYFHLTSTRTGTDVMPGDGGVIISHRLAELCRVGKGGTLKVTDADNQAYTLTVADVTENYIQNYIYMSPGVYRNVFGAPASYNMIVSDFDGNEKALAGRLIDSGRIVNVTFTDDILRQALQESRSLNSVVLLLICVASLLVIIVLYNLTSINISERIREIATLKVLGFTDAETNEYIYREAFLLTLISIGVGLLLGIGFHHVVMGYIERDEYEYFKTIRGLSFVWTSLITLAFSVVMQIATYFKLKKVDMVESLKSVE